MQSDRFSIGSPMKSSDFTEKSMKETGYGPVNEQGISCLGGLATENPAALVRSGGVVLLIV
jgi:hypothetical protein